MGVRKPLIAGNWKMHGRRADLAEFAALRTAVARAASVIDVLICPPGPYLEAAAAAVAGSALLVGAQDCSPVAVDSARTGEVSAAMLAECGARYVIVGHSERRAQHNESNALVRAKAEAAMAAGLTPIICLGETEAERSAGRVAEIVSRQLAESAPETATAALLIAYEPVWAIGGNSTPTRDEIAEVHALIRAGLERRYAGAAGMRILYGGSVSPRNAAEIFSCKDVDGALVGRASLKAVDFSAIILAHPAARAAVSAV